MEDCKILISNINVSDEEYENSMKPVNSDESIDDIGISASELPSYFFDFSIVIKEQEELEIN